MKQISIFLMLILFVSCIPVRIAPSIKEDKLMLAKKFKKHLPKHHAFIFEDPKNSNAFYHYINTKFKLNHKDVEFNTKIKVEGKDFFLSFYEIEIPTKTVNLIPIAIDATLDRNDIDPIATDLAISRIGNWYLALTVSDGEMKDCLHPNFEFQAEIIAYLREVKKEYLYTNNLMELSLKKN